MPDVVLLEHRVRCSREHQTARLIPDHCIKPALFEYASQFPELALYCPSTPMAQDKTRLDWTMLQNTRMSRSRLYVLIDSFENDMRNILARYILDYLPEAEALGPVYDKTNDRRNTDDPTGRTSIVSYLEMQEAYDCLNRHREMLPEELGRELRSNTPLLNQLVQIRNRVMHGRPLNPGDPENAINACIAFSTRYWNTIREALDHLQSDPTWEPAFEQQPRLSERTLHNLPLPEYDETGLIGRSSDCRKITGWLLKRREPIITIRGEGGIGKTALAPDLRKARPGWC